MRKLGVGCLQRSSFDEAIQHFSEGILLLPKLDMYAKERKQFYRMRAECQLNKVIVDLFHYSACYYLGVAQIE